MVTFSICGETIQFYYVFTLFARMFVCWLRMHTYSMHGETYNLLVYSVSVQRVQPTLARGILYSLGSNVWRIRY